MNIDGLKQLAQELKDREYGYEAEKLLEELHVHQKGIPRKEEKNKLRQTDHFKEELKKVLKRNKLYQDCLNFNLDDDSLLMKEYNDYKEGYDEIFRNHPKRYLKKIENYKMLLQEKEEEDLRQYLKSLNIESLISEVEDEIESTAREDIENCLLHKKLTYREDTYNPYNNWYTHKKLFGDITVNTENYENFIEAFSDIEEEELLSLTRYKKDYFPGIISEEILKKHPEITERIGDESDIRFYEIFDDEICGAGINIYCDLVDDIKEELPDILSRNKYLKGEFQELETIRKNVLNRIPEKIPDLFPETRMMERKFILHIGPTNSGKTYSSMERLKEAGNGIYLGPLRLLAFEQFQKLNDEGYPCSLYTGEEHQIIPYANIQSSTIEMASLSMHYDIAVIDEAQMVADHDRGWAWVQAILGLKADEIHICAAPYAKDVLISLINECGDSYSVIEHHRQTPLSMDKDIFSFKKKFIQEKDALIVFSKRNVHSVARELQNWGFKCSVIYGNLPYDVRQEEARRFRDGETDVIVATDAIGMGMNLPIRRVILLELSKYDGVSRRPLKAEEIQQIIGRAGRRGLYEKGLWNMSGDKKKIHTLIKAPIPPIETVHIGFPELLIDLKGKLSFIMKEWGKISLPEGYCFSSLEHEKKLCEMLEKETTDKHLIYTFITIPFDDEKPDLLNLWYRVFSKVKNNEMITLDSLNIEDFDDAISLEDAENLYKRYDLAYACFEKFGVEKDVGTILLYKKELSKKISEILKSQKLPYRVCKYCGEKLDWDYPYGMCNSCYQERYGYRKYRYYDDDYDWDDDYEYYF